MRLDTMTSKLFDSRRESVKAAILPIGTIEAHGMHGPLGTDIFIPSALSRLLEERHPETLLLLPDISYGHSWDLGPFPGTVDVPADLFSAYVGAVGKSLLGWGLATQVWMNGHGGNMASLGLAAESVADMGGEILIINWWADFRPEIQKITDGAGHGGADETSVVMSLDPTLVRMEDATKNPRPPAFTFKSKSFRMRQFEGAVTGDPTYATAEKGRAILEMCVQKVEQILKETVPGAA